MSIQGRYFDATSAKALEATLESMGGPWRLSGGGRELLFDPSQVKISDRLGNIPRRIRFEDGSEFESPDNDGIDALLMERGKVRGTLVHALERRWGIALAALAGVALVTFAFIKYGVPALAGWTAQHVPASVDQRIGAQTLDILDNGFLRPSRLPLQQQSRVDNLFRRMTAGMQDGHDYRLEFRSGAIGTNAFALPSGIIVISDDMVKLAHNDEELMAVLAHEIGHVRGRHALRQIIQAAGVSAMALVLLGDVSTISSLVAAGPALLQARNSRELEAEADGFSREWLQANGIATSHFDAIMCRLESQMHSDELPSFLSSHPATRDRAKCTPEPEAPAAEEPQQN
jgi:Zn-dependent protease with chaperone function